MFLIKFGWKNTWSSNYWRKHPTTEPVPKHNWSFEPDSRETQRKEIVAKERDPQRQAPQSTTAINKSIRARLKGSPLEGNWVLLLLNRHRKGSPLHNSLAIHQNSTHYLLALLWNTRILNRASCPGLSR